MEVELCPVGIACRMGRFRKGNQCGAIGLAHLGYRRDLAIGAACRGGVGHLIGARAISCSWCEVWKGSRCGGICSSEEGQRYRETDGGGGLREGEVFRRAGRADAVSDAWGIYPNLKITYISLGRFREDGGRLAIAKMGARFGGSEAMWGAGCVLGEGIQLLRIHLWSGYVGGICRWGSGRGARGGEKGEGERAAGARAPANLSPP